MARPTVTVTVNADDLFFITNSISLNVSCESEMSKDEIKTSRKMCRAQFRLSEKVNATIEEAENEKD